MSVDEHRTGPPSPPPTALWPHPSQTGLLAARKLGHRAVNCSCVYLLSGELDEQRLSWAYESTLATFDVLRLALEEHESRSWWHRVDAPRFEVRREDLVAHRPAPTGKIDKSLAESLQRRADRAFTLATGPVGMVEILKVDRDKWIVVESFDHVFADGRSLAVLHDRVSRLYRNPAEQCPRRDGYTALLLDGPQESRPTTAEFWRTAFEGFEHVVPGPPPGHAEPDEWRTSLDPRRIGRLTRAAGRSHGTIASAFLAAHAHAVARHLGTGDIATQIAIDSRDERSSDTFGQLTSLVPLRVRHDWSRHVGAQVSALTRATLAMRDHLDIDVETLDHFGAPVGLGGPDANAFVMQEAQAEVLELPGVEVTPILMRSSDQVGGLVTVARRRPDGSVGLSVRAPRGSHFAGVLTSVGETIDATLGVLEDDPDTPLGSDLLLPTAARQLIVGVSRPSPPYPFSALTDDVISNLIALGQRPVLDGDRAGTANELLLRIRGIERVLLDLAVSPGEAVTVGDLPVIDRIAAFVAVLHVGAVYVPFAASEPTAERERKERITRAAARLTSAGAARLRNPEPGSATEAGPRSPAYVIFTSGSSGASKAVAVSRESLSNLVQGEAARFGIGPESRVLLVAPPTVDPWICHVAAALLFRATLVPAGGMSDIPLAEQLRTRRVTHAFLPAALLRSLDSVDLPDLQMIATAGDHCRAEDLAAFEGKRIFNIYGPTEVTVTAAVAEFTTPTDPVPIGGPIRGLGARVLIDRAAGAPPGVDGELVFSGIGVAIGYEGDEALTAKYFGDDPFNPGHRWYFTGDRARLTTDGSFVLGGRVDRQVKIRGIRVEPEFVEAAARASGLCVDARANSFTVPPSIDKRLVLFVEGCLDVEVFTEALRARVPQHAWPHHVVAVDHLPRTAAGKVSDEQLQQDYATRAPHDRQPMEPTGALGRIWAGLLGFEPSPKDNFFSSGGDSLTVLRLVKDARAKGMVLSPSDVYAHPRYGDLERLAGTRRSPADGGSDESVSRSFPLGPSQQWFLAQNFSNPRWWNQRHAIAFDRLPSWGHLERALAALVAATPILGAAIDGTAGLFVVREPAPIQVTILDAEETDVVLCGAIDELSGAIDHLGGVVLRALAVRGSRGDGVLVLVAHHLVVDTWSWNVVEQRLRRILDGDPASALGIDQGFSRFATAIARQVDTGAFDLDAPLWADVLSGGRTVHRESRPRVIERVVRVLGDADDVTSGWGAPPSRVLLASIGHALLESEGPGVTVVDLERNGRSAVAGLDVSDAVGWFALHHPVELRHEVLSAASIGQVSANVDDAPDFGLGYGALRWSRRADLGDRVGRFAVDVSNLHVSDPGERGALIRRVRALPVSMNFGNRLPYEATITFRHTDHEISAIMDFDLDRITADSATSLLDSIHAAVRKPSGASTPRAVNARTTPFHAPVPASTMQRLMIHHAGRAPGTYRARQLLALGPATDAAALLDAVEVFLGSFDPFRRRFTTRGGDLVQVWSVEEVPVPVRRSDTGLSGADGWLASSDRVDSAAVAAGGPTVDAVAFVEGNDLLLGLEVHHAVMDGRSNRVLVRELDRFVSSWGTGDVTAAPPASTHRQVLRKHVAAELAMSPAGGVPQPTEPTVSAPTTSSVLGLPGEVVHRLTDWADRNSVDLRSALSAATAGALRATIGVDIMHVVVNGRDIDIPGTADALGMFWYFQSIGFGEDSATTAKSVYAAAARPTAEIRAAAAQWPGWAPEGASFNFTKQEAAQPFSVIQVIGSRDLFHFDTQCHVDLLLDGSALIHCSTKSPGKSATEVLDALSAEVHAMVEE